MYRPHTAARHRMKRVITALAVGSMACEQTAGIKNSNQTEQGGCWRGWEPSEGSSTASDEAKLPGDINFQAEGCHTEEACKGCR